MKKNPGRKDRRQAEHKDGTLGGDPILITAGSILHSRWLDKRKMVSKGDRERTL